MEAFRRGPVESTEKYFAEAASFEDPLGKDGNTAIVSVLKLVRRGVDAGETRAKLTLAKESSIVPVDLALGDGPKISYFLHGAVGTRTTSKNSGCLASLLPSLSGGW